MRPKNGEAVNCLGPTSPEINNNADNGNMSANNNNSLDTTSTTMINDNEIPLKSPSTTKPPTHYHHPEYLNAIKDQITSQTGIQPRQMAVNIHPETGVDKTSLIESDHWELLPILGNPNKSSWYSRWRDREEEEENERIVKEKEDKRKRNVEEVQKLPCMLGKMVLKEQEKLEASMELHGLDPRLASRSPSANSPLSSKPRYGNPSNSSPSRTLKELRNQTYSLRSLSTPLDQNENDEIEKPDVEIDNTNPDHIDNSTFIKVNNERYHKLSKGQSMPDIRERIKIFPYHILTTLNPRLPKGVNRAKLEQHLNVREFNKIFEMTREQFYRLPIWKRIQIKKDVHLF